MKTKVSGLLIRGQDGVLRRVSARCANGDFKKKYIRNLIDQDLLQPTGGAIEILGELIDENLRLKKVVKSLEKDLRLAEDTIDSIDEAIYSYYESFNRTD